MVALASTHGKTFQMLTFPFWHLAVLPHINEKKKSEFSIKWHQNCLVSAHEIIWRINEQIGGTESINSVFEKSILKGAGKWITLQTDWEVWVNLYKQSFAVLHYSQLKPAKFNRGYGKTTQIDINSPSAFSSWYIQCHFIIFSGIVTSQTNMFSILHVILKPYDLLSYLAERLSHCFPSVL